jgi:hypothetical protein
MFFFSQAAALPTWELLPAGLVGVLVGIVLMRTNPLPPPPESGRFRLFNRAKKVSREKGARKP